MISLNIGDQESSRDILRIIQGDSLDVKGSSPPSHAAFNGCIPHETLNRDPEPNRAGRLGDWETGGWARPICMYCISPNIYNIHIYICVYIYNGLNCCPFSVLKC